MEICCMAAILPSHIMGELLYLLNFTLLSLPSNFIQCMLPFSCGLIPHVHLGYYGKEVVTIICADHAKYLHQIWRYKNSPSMLNRQNGCHTHNVTQWSKKDPVLPCKFLGLNLKHTSCVQKKKGTE